MPQDELAAPKSAEELYAARGEDVRGARPLLTGDVIRGIVVPGFDEPGLAIILTHPCSMRADGVNLAPRLLMGRVVEADPVPLAAWRTGHYRRMPLPELEPATHFGAPFDEIGSLTSDIVRDAERVACMSSVGINLLQQRLIFSLTRLVVPTAQLNEVSVHIFEEADLMEEWVTDCEAQGIAADEGAAAFHAFIREQDDAGISRQEYLADPQRRAPVRREARERCRDFLAAREGC